MMTNLFTQIEQHTEWQTRTFQSYANPLLLNHQKINKYHWVSLLQTGMLPFEEKPMAIRGTHLFELKGVQCIAYEADTCFFVYLTIYNIYLGVVFKNGKLKKEWDLSQCVGYDIDENDLIEILQKCKLPKRNFSLFFKKKQQKQLLFNSCSNLGHHIWNEQTGLDTFLELGLLASIDGVLLGDYDYLNFTNFFKENNIPISRFRKKNKEVFSSRAIIVHPTELVIPSKTLERLRYYLSLKTTHENSNVIVLQLRQNSRKWLEEEQGLIQLIQALYKLNPSTMFIIDGFSKSTISTQSEKQNIKKDFLLYQNIKKHLSKEVKLSTTIGLPMLKKLDILNTATLFFSPIGSGGVLANWLLRKKIMSMGLRLCMNGLKKILKHW
jgi:hypothetical protein